jgi:hypothetical protein
MSMNLSQIDFAQAKKWLMIGGIGFVVLFLSFSFLSSYYQYKTSGPISEEAASIYDETSFQRLQAELTKDKPEREEQPAHLTDIVQQTNERVETRRWQSGGREVYSEANFDTLAVNCTILLEKYKELAIQYHELKQQVESTGNVSPKREYKYGSPAVNRSSGKDFDYTKYVRSSTTNELLNERGGTTTRTDAEFSWVTLTLPQDVKVFDQSVVTFDIAEPFVLDGEAIPRFAKVEGTTQVSRGRGRVFIDFQRILAGNQLIPVEGEAFSLDKARGINVYIHGESTLAQNLVREAGDLASLVDPSRSGVARSLINDADLGREVYANIEAGSMLLARITRR